MRRPSTSAHAAGFLQRGWSALRGLTFASLAAATLAALLPAPVAAEQRTSRNDIVYKPAPAIPVVAVQFLQEESTEALVEHFPAAGYDRPPVLWGAGPVPPRPTPNAGPPQEIQGATPPTATT